MNPSRHLDWRLLPLLLLPILGIWLPPLFDLDEGAFTAATTEMFFRDDFLTTFMLGEPRYDKPILIYWLQVASVSLFGHNEFGFRLPSALAASAWLGLTWAFVGRVLDRAAARQATLILATSVGLVVIQRAATADALLNLFLAAAAYASWLWLQEQRPRWLYLAYAAMGLGFLTKGPVAVVVPGMAVALWCLSQRDGRRFLSWAWAPKAWLLFAVIALPWFVALVARDGWGFIQGFFIEHNLSRYDDAMESHGGSYLYYLPVLLLTLLPHTGLLLSSLAVPGRIWRDAGLRYGLLWFLFVLVFFSFSGTKLPHYIYYGYGGLLLILAWRGGELHNRWLALLPASLLFALLLALPELLTLAAPRLKPDDRLLAAGAAAAFGGGYYAWFAAALALSLVLPFLRRLSLADRMYLNGLAAACGVALFLLPAVGQLLQQPIRQAGLVARHMPDPLVMYGITNPSFQTYAGRPVRKGEPRPGELVFTRQSRLEKLPPGQVIFQQRGYVLYRVP